MAKTLLLTRAESVHDLKQALRRSNDAAQKTRLRAIISLAEGATKEDTASKLVVSRTSVISWVAAYNQGGIEALAMSHGGRPEGNPKWAASLFEALAREIDKGGYWSVPRMREWLRIHYRKDIPEQTVWYRMDQLHYSYKSARPHPMQGNREKQEVFKKGGSLHSSRR